MDPLALAVIGCFLGSVILTGVARRYALTAGLIDHPGDRRSHHQPTPRGGGIAMVGVLAVVTAGLRLVGGLPAAVGDALLIAVVAMGAVGWWDDHRSLSARTRLAVQVVAAGLAMWRLGGLSPMDAGLTGWAPWMVNSGAILALVWLTNLFNFMDGIDGLAALEAVFVAVGLGGLSWLTGVPWLAAAAFLVAASAAGFLPWNFPRARVFMGDAGSAALGLGLGVLMVASLQAETASLPLCGLLVSLFLVDATATLLWRFLKGDQWYTAHREHAYQRLVRAGLSHVQVTLGAMALNLAGIAPLLWWARGDGNREWIAVVIAVTVLTLIWSATRKLKDHRRDD